MTLTLWLPGLPAKKRGPALPPPGKNVQSRGAQIGHSALRSRWRTHAKDWAAVTAGLPDMARAPMVLTVGLVRVSTVRAQALGFASLVAALVPVQDGLCDAFWSRCRKHAQTAWVKGGKGRGRGAVGYASMTLVARPCGSYHDEDPMIRWEWAQERGPEAGVRVEVNER